MSDWFVLCLTRCADYAIRVYVMHVQGKPSAAPSSGDIIKDAASLITERSATRERFLRFALEKNRVCSPHVQAAHTFKNLVKDIKTPQELIACNDVRQFLLSAAGLSDKSLAYMGKHDCDEALKNLCDNFLAPEEEHFKDEAVYRYLLIKGDAVGGSMRNLIGKMAEEEVLSCIFSIFNCKGTPFSILKKSNSTKEQWIEITEITAGLASDIKAMRWGSSNGQREFVLNASIPLVGKNVDFSLFCLPEQEIRIKELVCQNELALLMGELKGGIDPAGADEHWKTANTALRRIRKAFNEISHPIPLCFVGAAIEANMAEEIYRQYSEGTLAKVANLTKEHQLISFCKWLIEI